MGGRGAVSVLAPSTPNSDGSRRQQRLPSSTLPWMNTARCSRNVIFQIAIDTRENIPDPLSPHADCSTQPAKEFRPADQSNEELSRNEIDAGQNPRSCCSAYRRLR